MRLIRNDRQQKIDSFLKFWKDVLVQNPDIELNNSSIIYNELIRIGVPESERKINVHDVGLFDYWVRYFSKANNINVFDFQNFIANYYNSKLISNQVGDIEIFNDMDDRETRPNFERRENYK